MTHHNPYNEDWEICQKTTQIDAVDDFTIDSCSCDSDTKHRTTCEILTDGALEINGSDDLNGNGIPEGYLLNNIQEDGSILDNSIDSSTEYLIKEPNLTIACFEGEQVDENANVPEHRLIAEKCDSQLYDPTIKNNDAINDICPIIGHIDGFNNGHLEGWILCASSNQMPQLYVDDEEITQLIYPIPRPDVNETLGVSGDCGFAFKLSGVQKGSVAKLCATLNGRRYEIASYVLENGRVEGNFIKQLDIARKIARETDSVAITCWEGAHNPIGRAKVLYDVVSVNRACVLISYIFGDFGTELWTPLINSNINVLTIPWVGRERYHKLLLSAGISFDTVWICKPRLPSFELARIIANRNAAVVLDIDDNEDHFSTSITSTKKAYGVSTINYANYLTEKIVAKTAASVSLAEKYGARIVRHAREGYLAKKPRRQVDLKCDTIKVGFIGTARSHKNLASAAQAIKCFSWSTGISAQLHVYGDISPKSLVTSLEDNGVIVRGIVPMDDLHRILSEMDVILTGFPTEDEASKPTTDFQISSKIGDGLAVGRPVLVPDTPSVVDLNSLEGVYLFSKSTFSTLLYKAVNSCNEISLPSEFSFEDAWAQFVESEKMAKNSDLASEVFDLMPTIDMAQVQTDKTLILLWKQNDSDCYGRRVDQLARSYKKQRPHERVIILELLHENTRKDFIKLSQDYTSEHGLLLGRFNKKQRGCVNQDGVELHQLLYKNRDALDHTVQEFLVNNLVLPEHTVFVLFPIIQFYETIERTLSAYPKIVDVVDNQCSWGNKDSICDRVNQYRILFNASHSAIFNSSKNLQYFIDELNQESAVDFHVIPNWYQLPQACESNDKRKKGNMDINVIYSGNLNDRIDWDLLEVLAAQRGHVRIHIVGTANRSLENLKRLTLNKNVIYHGPLSERDTIQLLRKMDLAIMPHRADDISKFMNPLKVHMYGQLGVHTLSSKVEGINASPTLTIARSKEDFIDQFNALTNSRRDRHKATPQLEEISTYINIIDKVRDSIKL